MKQLKAGKYGYRWDRKEAETANTLCKHGRMWVFSNISNAKYSVVFFFLSLDIAQFWIILVEAKTLRTSMFITSVWKVIEKKFLLKRKTSISSSKVTPARFPEISPEAGKKHVLYLQSIVILLRGASPTPSGYHLPSTEQQSILLQSGNSSSPVQLKPSHFQI